MDSSRRRDQNRDRNEELEENNEDPSTNHHEPWIVATAGLDEALIKSITVCKYKKGDGLIEGTDCSVCLSEFEDDESLKLLPKCSHAFHVTCIDTWLKSHSNCPLCRANIVLVNASPVIEARPVFEPSAEIHENPVVEEDIEMGIGQEEEILQSDGFPKEFIGLSDSGNLEVRDAIIEIREEEDRPIRRSVSMDFVCQGRGFSIADAMRLKQDEVFQAEEECQVDVGSSKQPGIEMISKCSHNRSRVLHCVMGPVVMKRSFSSGRFSFSRRGRGTNTIIPF